MPVKDGIILHHYPQSPVAEKVRVVLGMKGLEWRAVEIPRIPPKPLLMPLTGGYRRTPVLQIGADIYCDSLRIIHALEERCPEPTLFPGGGAGMPWGVSRWTDERLLDTAVSVVLGAQADRLPQEFAADRGRLYFGPDYDLQARARALPHYLAQFRAQLQWVDQRLASGRAFMLGEQPGLPDALVYYIVWFLRGRFDRGPDLLREFDALLAWEQRVAQIGHGTSRALGAQEALTIARDAVPGSSGTVDERDPQNLRSGMRVQIAPDTDGGDPGVEGTVVHTSAQTICIRREDPQVGQVNVHFPRVGYRVDLME